MPGCVDRGGKSIYCVILLHNTVSVIANRLADRSRRPVLSTKLTDTVSWNPTGMADQNLGRRGVRVAYSIEYSASDVCGVHYSFVLS